MRLTRIYYPKSLVLNDPCILVESVYQHLVVVLRHKVGDRCVLFNADDGEYVCRIDAIGKKEAQLVPEAKREVYIDSPLKVHLYQALCRGSKMDWVLQKATELGVARITPIITRYTEVKVSAEKMPARLQHWHQVVVAACEQSGRTTVPVVDTPMPFSAALSDMVGCRLLLSLAGDTDLGYLPVPQQCALLVGPEGGFSEEELLLAKEQAVHGWCLGPRTLRAETAGLTALSILQYAWGDLA